MLLKRSFLAVVGVAVNVIACAPDPVSPRPLVQRGDVRFAYGGDPGTFNTTWYQGFEVDAVDWTSTVRVPSGTNGVTSASGAFHGEAESGALTRFNAYSSVWPGDYVTEVDVYLDPAWDIGQGFDYSVATNGITNAHRRDFIFHLGVTPTGGLRVFADNNSDLAGVPNAFILDQAGSVEITTAGWYKLQHVFYDNAGVLAVDMRLLNSGGAALFSTTRSDPSDQIGVTVGGNRYGWFVFSTRSLAIDNHRRATAAPQSPGDTHITVTPLSPVFGVNNVVGVPADAAPGFPGGSFASNGVAKSDMYFTPEALFQGREVTVGQVARMSYWTRIGTTHVVNPADWFMNIYTKPFAGDVSTPTWYGSRFGTEPYFSANIADPANTWNLWSTNLDANTLRFFESTQGAPGANFGSYTDPAWALFIAFPSLGTSVHRASQAILFFSIQTGSAWATGFTGQLDGLRIELTDGSVATVNFEPVDEAPVVTNVEVTPNPAPYTTASYALTATASDDFAVTSASYTVDGGAAVAFSFTAGSPVALSASLGALAAGVHEVCVTAQDAALNSSNTECTLLAVYDPSAGFVTGGGWFTSPAGAYVPDAQLTGKATFGFVSKYVKGKTEPTGNTSFAFQTATLSFSSDSYQWLVVNQAGTNAQFKGVGILNGVPGHQFMVWAKDGDPDTFRIKISDPGGTIVYDNTQDGEFGTELGGGSISIHVRK